MRTKRRYLFLPTRWADRIFIVTTKIKSPTENSLDQAYHIVAEELGISHFSVRIRYHTVPMDEIKELNVGGGYVDRQSADQIHKPDSGSL